MLPQEYYNPKYVLFRVTTVSPVIYLSGLDSVIKGDGSVPSVFHQGCLPKEVYFYATSKINSR